jgi:hypothetical protein
MPRHGEGRPTSNAEESTQQSPAKPSCCPKSPARAASTAASCCGVPANCTPEANAQPAAAAAGGCCCSDDKGGCCCSHLTVRLSDLLGDGGAGGASRPLRCGGCPMCGEGACIHALQGLATCKHLGTCDACDTCMWPAGKVYSPGFRGRLPAAPTLRPLPSPPPHTPPPPPTRLWVPSLTRIPCISTQHPMPCLQVESTSLRQTPTSCWSCAAATAGTAAATPQTSWQR